MNKSLKNDIFFAFALRWRTQAKINLFLNLLIYSLTST